MRRRAALLGRKLSELLLEVGDRDLQIGLRNGLPVHRCDDRAVLGHGGGAGKGQDDRGRAEVDT